MRVLMLCPDFYPFNYGGIGIAAYCLARELLRRGIEVFLSPPGGIEPIALGGEAVPSEGLFTGGGLGYGYGYYGYGDGPVPVVDDVSVSRLADAARALRIDLVYAHDWMSLGVAETMARVLGIPLFAHVHSTEYERTAGFPIEGIQMEEGRGLRAAGRIAAVSNRSAAIIGERYEIPASKIVVVHNGFLRRPRLPRSRIYREHVVLFLGRLTRQKGPDLFLEAARRVLDRGESARFVVAGSGDQFENLLEHAQRLGIERSVEFTGYLDREAVPRILAASDLLVFPSRSEPFGMVPLEAMHAGVPVIAARDSGVAELITQFVAVAPEDVDAMAIEILSLLRDPIRRADLAERGRREADTVTWQEAGSILEREFRLLTDGTPTV